MLRNANTNGDGEVIVIDLGLEGVERIIDRAICGI